MEKKRVLIAGGGASGLLAAIFAAKHGAAVTVLEQNEKMGKKICATGNGKCNLTNLAREKGVYRGTNPSFADAALTQFSVSDTLAFFEKLGIYPVNKNNYMYPRSNQAQSVVDVLVMEARNLGVKLKTQEKVMSVLTKQDGKRPFLVKTQGWQYEGDALILANGSRASSISGSDGSGYEIARSLGHTIVKPLPALTALKCRGQNFKGWAGVRTEGRITLYVDGSPFQTEQGELQLTEYGISGIPVFQLSRYAVRALDENRKAVLSVDFFPDLDKEGVCRLLDERKENCPYKSTRELLTGLFPEKLIKILTDQPELIPAIKEFSLEVTAGLSFEHAQVCSGGVDVCEVSETTMESKLVPGLYFAGELLDIDGACGGYNLQWAWSSGAAAGRHSALAK